MRKSMRNVIRNWYKSVLIVLVCALITFFLFLYIGALHANQRQLTDLPSAMPVYGRICNLNGSLNTGLMVSERIIEGLEGSAHVAEFSYTAHIGAALNRIDRDRVQEMEIGDLTFPLAYAANHLGAYPGIGEQAVSFLPGVNPMILASEEAVCLMREQELERHGLKLGDMIDVTLFSPSYPTDNYVLDYRWLGVYQVQIAGSYSESWSDEASPAQVLFPSQWIRKIHRENEAMFNADSVRFRVAHPLALNDFKAEMKSLWLMSVLSQAGHSHRGIALVVGDESFIKAASRLQDNIMLMKVFTPFLFTIVGLVGFVVSYLLLHNRRPEIAVMRSLGMSRSGCFLLLLSENLLLVLSGSALGTVFALFFTDMGIAQIYAVVGLFFACYITGTVSALYMVNKFSVMAVLSTLE